MPATKTNPDTEDQTPKDDNPVQAHYDREFNGIAGNYDETADHPNDHPSSTDEKTSLKDQVAKDESDFSKPSKKTGSSANPEKSLYNNAESTDNKGIQKIILKAQNWRGSNWKVAGGVGGLIIVLVLIVGAFFSFLNVFKLEHFMQNVEVKGMARYISATDKRSSKWIESYIKIRLSSLKGDGSDSPLFRSDRVDTNNPLTDWYKTMKASSFEADLAKRGIVFTNYTGVDGVQKGFAILEVDGKKIAGIDDPNISMQELRRKIDLDGFIKGVEDFDLDKPGDNKAARLAVKKIVNENTHSWNVIKRRQLRKSIENMTGIRSWRFFETTRDKYDAKKLDFKRKLVTTMLPETTKSGRLLGCLMGASDCKNISRDTADPVNKTYNPLTTNGDTDSDTRVKDPDTDTNVKNDNTASQLVDAANNSVDMPFDEKILSLILQIKNFANWTTALVMIVDTLSKIDENMRNGSLTKVVYIAKLTSLMGAYQTLGTMQDQIKTGELTATEVGEAMNELNGIGNNDAWKAISDSSTSVVSAASDDPFVYADGRVEYCSEEHQALKDNPAYYEQSKNEYAYNCDVYKPNGGNRAESLTNLWNSTYGRIEQPLFEAYRGSGIGKIVDLFNTIVGKIVDPLINGLISLLGIQDDLERFITWVMLKVAGFLGAGPLVTDLTTPPQIGVFALSGAAASQSVALRDSGAAISTPETMVAANQVWAEYMANKNDELSLYEKYISLDNYSSIASGLVGEFATLSTDKNGIVTTLAAMPGKVIGSLSGLLSTSKIKAADSDTHRIDTYSGVDSYDYRPVCMDKDVIDTYNNHPKNSTNIQSIPGINVADSELTWDLLRNSEDWYAFVYRKVGEAVNGGYSYGLIGWAQQQSSPLGEFSVDDVAMLVHNCELLENTVRGGLGYVNGYTDDNSYGSNQVTAPAPVAGNLTCTDPESAVKVYWPTNPHPYGNTHDLRVPVGTKVYAIKNGTVTESRDLVGCDGRNCGDGMYSYGRFIVINHGIGNGPITYAHLSERKVNVGDRVVAGQLIGLSGESGNASGPHLHIDFNSGTETVIPWLEANNALDPPNPNCASAFLDTPVIDRRSKNIDRTSYAGVVYA